MTLRAITYTEAIDILQKSDKKFEYPIKWGSDLQTRARKVYNGGSI